MLVMPSLAICWLQDQDGLWAAGIFCWEEAGWRSQDRTGRHLLHHPTAILLQTTGSSATPIPIFLLYPNSWLCPKPPTLFFMRFHRPPRMVLVGAIST